jgi:hypothetical protein
MLLVDAIHINNGGGLVLLESLTPRILAQFTESVHFLLDSRLQGKNPQIPPNQVTYVKPALLPRLIATYRQRNRARVV